MKSTKIGKSNRKTVYTDIIPGKIFYDFPPDMKELMYLHIEGAYMDIKDNQIVLQAEPTEYLPNAIKVEYI